MIARPRIAERLATEFTACLAAGLLHHRAPLAHTDPAAIARWAEWTPTHQWMAEHGRKENSDV